MADVASETAPMEPLPELAPEQMIVRPYNKNSIAVFGNTKSWKENIKCLGGIFNNFLRPSGPDGPVKPGWVFPKDKEKELREFVEDANAGNIKRMSPSTAAAGAGPRARLAAGQKMQYQKITYNVPLPYVGQGVTLTIPDDSESMLSVVGITNDRAGGIVDICTLQGSAGEKYTGAIVSGVWEILDFCEDHTLTFH